jgi:hypothetical protein
MKYILMMNTPERGAYSIFNWPKKDFEAHMAYWKSLNTELEKLGELVAVEGLTSPDQAKLVRAGKERHPRHGRRVSGIEGVSRGLLDRRCRESGAGL